MIRDVNGNIHIIDRAHCKNDTVYYEKIYNIKMGFTKKYKSVVNIPKIENSLTSKYRNH